MRVYAVRHGQSGFNLQHLCNDDPARPGGDLTALGRAQAGAAAQHLSGAAVDVVYCSRLPRARQTAELIAERLALPVRVDARLNDIRSGCDGRPVAEYMAAIAADPLRRRAAPGAETLLEHQTRVAGFLHWLAGQSHAGAVLVAHEETLRVFLAHAEGLSLAEVVGRPFANGAIYAFEAPGPRAKEGGARAEGRGSRSD